MNEYEIVCQQCNASYLERYPGQFDCKSFLLLCPDCGRKMKKRNITHDIRRLDLIQELRNGLNNSDKTLVVNSKIKLGIDNFGFIAE